MVSHKEIYKIDSKGKVRVYFIEQDGGDYRMVTGVKDGAQVRSKWTAAIPKNLGKVNETSPEIQAGFEIASKYTKKQNAGYFDTVADAKANPDGKFFEPMLATEWDKVKDKDKQFPLLADPKLDGMRMTTVRGETISRRGKHIPTVPHIADALQYLYKTYPNIRFDGEIYNHEYREDFNTLMSLARKGKPDEGDLNLAAQKLEYHIYDMYDYDMPTLTAVERKDWLAVVLTDFNASCIEFVDCTVVNTEQELADIKAQHLLDGYEGTIIRIPNSIYVTKRTKTLMKIKEFITEEFIIQDVVEGKGNKSGKAGAVQVLVENKLVDCGIRGSWEYCTQLLKDRDSYLGEKATIRHFGVTEDGSLRFPVCIDLKRLD